MPASLIVYAFVLLGSVVVLPEMRWPDIAYDVMASALYVQNFRLAAQSIDYLAQGYALSPLQHFWSLAIEEQFYLIWPLLIFLVFKFFSNRGLFRSSLFFVFLFFYQARYIFRISLPMRARLKYIFLQILESVR
ncbi:hypothetical protein D9M69_574540 [compost metagenome]